MAKKIVIVDDEPDVLMFLQTALEDNGYEVFGASNALDGFRIIKEIRPGLVCLDILMPEESGISLFRKLKTDPGLKDIPVVIQSGLSLSGDLDHVDFLELEDGSTIPEPDGYVEKPVDIDRFLAVVRKVIGP
jgi:CheY-like chemotaxis protein